MFICTKRIKEPSDNFFTYTILDTNDMTEESIKIDNVKKAFDLGINILGLCQSDKGIGIDTKYMSTISEYRYYNNENMHIPVNCINYSVDEGLVCLECNCPINDRYKVIYFVKNDDIIGNTGSIPRKDPKHGISYVDCNVDKVTEYRGLPLIQISLNYYDKHYYREDRGCEFISYKLILGNKGVVSTVDWFNNDDKYYRDWLIPDNCGQFKWCDKDVDLDIWF